MVIKNHNGKSVITDGVQIFLNTREVESSNVEWIGWPAPGTEVIGHRQPIPLMIVQYKGGARYGYIGVPRQRAVATALAKSVGSYINHKIKPHYKVVKLV